MSYNTQETSEIRVSSKIDQFPIFFKGCFDFWLDALNLHPLKIRGSCSVFMQRALMIQRISR